MEELTPITPVNFFQLTIECSYLSAKGKFPRLSARNYEEYLLPNTSVLCNEEQFADVAMGWDEEGIEFLFEVDKKFEQSFYPDVYRGDCVEVFIDTRNVKTSGFNTRFCHHFFFLPEAVEGRQAEEITHFRTEDAHDLCDPSELKVKTELKKESYTLHAYIPKSCLFGYDPNESDKIGFTYRVNRPKWQSQHLSVSTEDFKIEEQPSLWSHMRLLA